MKRFLPLVLMALLAACSESTPTANSTAVAQSRSCGVFAIGPNQIKEVLASAQAEPAPGRTAKADLPADFPAELLDPAGFYRGMAVYCTVDEARTALAAQQHADWGVYELTTDWASNVYQADDGAHHLSKAAPIKQAVQ